MQASNLIRDYININKKIPYISGKIDDNFVNKLRKTNSNTVMISSSGGRMSAGFEAAEYIITNKLNLIVKTKCLSACAELLLPAANSIVFKDKPLVGFHGNALMSEHAAYTYKYDEAVANCGHYQPARNQEKLYEFTGHNIDFWEIQLEHLELKEPQFWYHEGCPLLEWKFKNNFWFPTAEQLRIDFGLKFTGDLCSEDKECYERIISIHWKKGSRLAVGENIFIAKGRLWGTGQAFKKSGKDLMPN